MLLCLIRFYLSILNVLDKKYFFHIIKLYLTKRCDMRYGKKGKNQRKPREHGNLSEKGHHGDDGPASAARKAHVHLRDDERH